jgi:hypothetical protein
MKKPQKILFFITLIGFEVKGINSDAVKNEKK